MAAPVLNRNPTCLSCLRRLAVPMASSRSGPAPVSAVSHLQVRGKKKSTRQSQGIVVRLLEDVPKFGRRHAIFPVERGRMRNLWYPAKKAEYMTAARFQELGLSRNDIGERDTLFGTSATEVEDLDDFAVPQTPAVEVQGLAPERAQALLSFLVPDTLTFTRKPIHAPEPQEPAAPRSPLLAANASVSTGAAATAATTTGPAPATSAAIFGSVTTADIAAAVKALLITDPEASRVAVEAGDVRFVGLEAGADRVKSLGRWEVDIAVGQGVEPVRKAVEVVVGE